MVAEAELLYKRSIPVIDVQYKIRIDSDPMTTSFCSPCDDVSFENSSSESVVSCSSAIQTTVIHSPCSKFIPHIRSGSHTDTGCRASNEDEHIRIDDLSARVGHLFGCPLPSSFYAVFDGHNGPNAAVFVKENTMKLFFEDANLPQTSEIDKLFLENLENSHREAFLVADQALAVESTVPSYCGTTALTALVVGRQLIVANAGDCRAVLCRKGVPVQLSNDHRPSYFPELKRVVDLGGCIEHGYLYGDLAVTRALGDWEMKYPIGSTKPLTAEPEVTQILLNEDDEFLIVACDGIWDVISNEEAVGLVRLGLSQHDNPQRCAKELVDKVLSKDTSDNVTAIVVSFTKPVCRDTVPQRPRLRCCSLSEEAKNKLRSFLGGN